MREDLHNELDDLFRSGLEGKEDIPSRSVWDGIEKALDRPSGTPPPNKPPSTGNFWIKGLAGITLITLIGTTMIFRSREKDSVPEAGIRTAQPRTEDRQAPLTAGNRQSSELARSQQVISGQGMNGNEMPDSPMPEKLPAGPATSPASHVEQVDGGQLAAAGTSIAHTDRQTIPHASPAVAKARPSADGSRYDEKTTTGSSGMPLVGSEKNNGSAYTNRILLVPDAASPDNAAMGRTGADKIPTGKERTSHALEGREMAEVMHVQSATTDMAPSRPNGRLVGNIPTPRLQMATPKLQTASSAAPKAAPAKSTALRPSPLLSRFSITPVMGVHMTGRHIRENESYGGRNGREHEEYREMEEYRTTVSPGILGEFSVTPLISIQSGITGLRNNVSVESRDIKAVRDRDGNVRYRLDCSAGSYYIDPKSGIVPSVGDSIRVRSTEISTRYASIPVQLKFNGGSQRLRYYALAGMDVNLLVGRNASTMQAGTMEKTTPARSEGLKSNYLNGVVGGGVDIRLGKRTAFSIMPQYRFALKDANEGSPVRSYPRSFSIVSGLKVSF